ncbi:hypothetical protein NW761_014685 [Fusarium oxysporum]|nr:hypothetical protein NW758_014883 [Fusarium oxysporum]KAJ4072670.1 hypothetical protein NW761_014685 [Fusarium oxysporum]
MEPSLPEEDGVSQTYYGSGDNIAGNKYGGNHNEYSGSGTAYFGAVTQHVYPETKTELSLSQLCLRSLAFEGMVSRPTEIKTAAAGTCRWLLQHERYKTWESRDRSLLWIKGKPGSGKSTLLRYARDNVKASQKSKEKPLILSFFFNGRGTELQKTPEGLFRSLLCQLQSKLPEALEALEAIFKQREAAFGKYGERWQWDLSELRQYFELSLWTALETQPILLFVDALDECGEENAQSLAEEFSSLLQRPSSDILNQFRICFTCRHYPILNLDSALQICIENENYKDIAIFVDSRFSSFHERTGSKIAEFISQHAEGVFLWACLVVGKVLSLERERIGIERIEAEVRMVPQTLDEFYSTVIPNMDPSSTELIECICFASEPLSLMELRWVMILSHNAALQSLQECESKGNYPSNDAGMLWLIQTLCCGLVDYESDSKVVQFIHQSVKDFFLEKGLPSLRGSTEPEKTAVLAHYRLAQNCLRYMAMKEFDQPASQSNMGFKFPFLYYATSSWIWHAIRIPQDLQESFPWPSDPAVKQWLDLGHQLFVIPKNLSRRGMCQLNITDPTISPKGTTLLHIISRHGLTGALRSILKLTTHVVVGINAGDSWDRTPVSLAAQYGHTAIMELLLENGADPEGTLNHRPLPLAIEGGHSTVIELLLKKGVVMDYHYIAEYPSPLLGGVEIPIASHTYFSLFSCLGEVEPVIGVGVSLIGAGILYGARMYQKQKVSRRTPLSRAAELGDEEIVGLLLRYNADPNYPDKSGETPLSRAMKKDRKGIIQMLRESTN